MTRDYHGTVKWFDNAKGYGFLNSDSHDVDIFVHYRSIMGGPGFKTLSEGDVVEFSCTATEKGFSANECRRVKNQAGVFYPEPPEFEEVDA